VWVARRLNLSAAIASLKETPLVQVLHAVRAPAAPLSYADLSAPVFVCSKPLDLAESDNQVRRIRHWVTHKAHCPVGRCRKKLSDAEHMYSHLMEHQEFRSQSEEEQLETLNRLMFPSDMVCVGPKKWCTRDSLQ
jgi:hypothetical protein